MLHGRPSPTGGRPDVSAAALANEVRGRGCVRLSLSVDAGRLSRELAALGDESWGEVGRDPVVLQVVESLFVVGYPRGVQLRPPDDRPVLRRLPYLREILHEAIAPRPLRAVVARQQPESLVPVHTDVARIFRGLSRLSIQVDADGPQPFYSAGLWYGLAPGEVWSIDNLRPHGVRNRGGSPRTSVIVDYAATVPIADLVAAGESGRGRVDAEATAAIERESADLYRAARWRNLRRWKFLSMFRSR